MRSVRRKLDEDAADLEMKTDRIEMFVENTARSRDVGIEISQRAAQAERGERLWPRVRI